MKKKYLILTVLIMAALLPLTAFALDFDSRCLVLEYSGAPEGTYYIDLLVDMDESDENYVTFNKPPQVFDKRDEQTYAPVYIDSSIGEDSETARYNEGGYVSFSMHNRLCTGLYIGDRIESEISLEELFEKYHWKAAYVDENGNVLGVTGIADKTYDRNEPYALCANGDKASYRVFGESPAQATGIIVFIIIAAVIVVGLPAVLIVRYFVYMRKLSREQPEDEKLAEEERMRR